MQNLFKTCPFLNLIAYDWTSGCWIPWFLFFLVLAGAAGASVLVFGAPTLPGLSESSGPFSFLRCCFFSRLLTLVSHAPVGKQIETYQMVRSLSWLLWIREVWNSRTLSETEKSVMNFPNCGLRRTIVRFFPVIRDDMLDWFHICLALFLALFNLCRGLYLLHLCPRRE